MIGRVARLHYEHGLTHQQIADLVGVSRVEVTRLLAEARRTGVVDIRVHSDEAATYDRREPAVRDALERARNAGLTVEELGVLPVRLGIAEGPV